MRMDMEHADWGLFCELLSGKEGCNYNDEKKTWKCKGGSNKTFAIKILKKHFSDVDINKTIKYFDDNGGYCDCEILMNVDRR